MKNKMILFLLLIPASASYALELNLETAERLALESSSAIINAREEIQLACPSE